MILTATELNDLRVGQTVTLTLLAYRPKTGASEPTVTGEITGIWPTSLSLRKTNGSNIHLSFSRIDRIDRILGVVPADHAGDPVVKTIVDKLYSDPETDAMVGDVLQPDLLKVDLPADALPNTWDADESSDETHVVRLLVTSPAAIQFDCSCGSMPIMHLNMSMTATRSSHDLLSSALAVHAVHIRDI